VSPFFCTTLGPQEEIVRTRLTQPRHGRRASETPCAPHPPPRRDRSHTGQVRRATVRDGLCLTHWCVLVDVESARLDG
jgi:hypothetical protein